MSLASLLRHFHSYTTLPIEISDVRAWVEQHCSADRVGVYFSPMNPAILRGFLVRQRMVVQPYSGLQDVAQIHVSQQLDMNWRRLVAVKEMVHLHDGATAQVKTPEAFNRLCEDMIAHPYADGVARSYSPPAVADILALWSALAVLCPLPLVTAFRRNIGDGKMMAEEVAGYLAIPTEMMNWVLSPEFDDWVRRQMTPELIRAFLSEAAKDGPAQAKPHQPKPGSNG